MIRASGNDHNDRKIVSAVPHPASVGQQFPQDLDDRESDILCLDIYINILEMIKITIRK